MNKGSGSFNKGKSSGGVSKGSFGNQPSRPAATPKPVPSGPVNRPPVSPRPFTPAPVSQSAADILSQISALQTQVSWLQDSARLNQVHNAVEDVQTTINGMAQRIANLRQSGYFFERELENQAVAFTTQWAVLYPTIQQQLNVQSTTLMNSLRNLDNQMTQLNAQRNNPGMAQSLIGTINGNINSLQSQISAAERTVAGMYDQFNSQVNQVTNRLNAIELMLKEFAGATFQLLPTEGALMAVKAVYSPSGKEQKGDPEGMIFLTDQRILFEQKEEVVTKKVLFVATAKETVQELLWEAPVALVENVKTSKQGLMKNEDHIDIQFASGAPVYTVHLHIWQPAEEWQALINRAKSKEFDRTRAVAIDQAEVEKIKSAPTQCPSCGGTINQVILRGMDSITCEYCGMVIRLSDAASTSLRITETKELSWGTTTAILVRLGMQTSSVVASGMCSVAILDPSVYQQKIGNDSALQLQVRSLLALKLGDAIGQISSGISSADGLGARAVEIAGVILEAANPTLAAMGVKLTRVTIDGFSVNPANM